ncbi:hypothetical protein SEMRO_653_G181961.1 [Seminavis robusta]|uniref:Uncharacterized protein n=1 Tax=Seminavis robusta TaxID=568900 RepID=A0A9N8E893_9STRA|nr:hypothetical protein SEMRO_653_G181961.1 [Seminavis robusta]|eukprot:Sro653_g181961.1  (211) ;mRNA; f:48637-49269
MTGFVDDTNSRTNCLLSNEIPSVEELIGKAMKDAQWWNDLLLSSGRKLEATKCSFHHLRYEFCPSGEPKLVSGVNFTPKINVKSVDGIVTPIKPVANYDDHKSLGCYKGPLGKLAAPKAVLVAKCKHYTQVLKGSPLNGREADMLETTFFKDTVLDSIESAPRRAALQKMGFRANTAKVICYGSWKLGGIEMFRLADKQGIGVIQQFLKH